jgi:hypothetical protein
MNELFENINRIKKLMELEKDKVEDFEIKEDEDGGGDDGGSAASSGGGYPTVKKHSETYPTKRGKANTLDMKTKWESGVTRGKANKIDNSKWESGRTMGSTGP